LNPDDIKEGDDVYFECHVRANPHWRKLNWLHDVSKIYIFGPDEKFNFIATALAFSSFESGLMLKNAT
jgi:hypothetical protein